MATFSYFFILGIHPERFERAADALRTALGNEAVRLDVELHADIPIVRCSTRSFLRLESIVPTLTSLLDTEAVGFSVQTVADSFEYAHAVSGELHRHLAYGVTSERTWNQPIGTPEDWEDDCFWTQTRLDEELANIDELAQSGLLSESECSSLKDELTTAFETEELRPGSGQPAPRLPETIESALAWLLQSDDLDGTLEGFETPRLSSEVRLRPQMESPPKKSEMGHGASQEVPAAPERGAGCLAAIAATALFGSLL